ncbi:hypothetical protein [Spirosoma liriopis]|uniref:hypothetical protein n=1 Tax=Spirosoma liriopis TaxID=2937440 RepID=UPI0020BDE274|nr:hypothetical protein [Spirosoma liriopis]
MFAFSAIQPERTIQEKDLTQCVRALSIENKELTDSLQRYLKYVSQHEVPIVAVQKVGDTTHYYVSAFISTYSIKQNPPSAIVNFIDREALLYTGKSSLRQTSPKCYQALLKKYHKLLHIDVINERDKVNSDNPPLYTHDPISADVAVATNGRIVMHSNGRFPFTK